MKQVNILTSKVIALLLLTIGLQAQPKEYQSKDTLFFSKKSNPERSIVLPLEEISVNIYWKNGEVDRAYVIGLENNLIELRVYADEKEDRNERRKAKLAVNQEKSLTYHEKIIKKRKIDYQTFRVGKIESIDKIEIRNRNLKGTPISHLLLVSDVTIGTSLVAFYIFNFLHVDSKNSVYFILGLSALDGVAFMIDLIGSQTIIRPKDWTIGSTFND
jgi:hypothetical protein